MKAETASRDERKGGTQGKKVTEGWGLKQHKSGTVTSEQMALEDVKAIWVILVGWE